MSELSKAMSQAREIVGAIEEMAERCRHQMKCNLSVSGEPCSDRYYVNFDVSWSAGGSSARDHAQKHVNTREAYEAWCRALNEKNLERDAMQMRAERLNKATDAAKDREWSTLLRDGYVSTSTGAGAGADYDVDLKLKRGD